MSLNDKINTAKENSKHASDIHSAAKQRTIEMGDKFYSVKKKADSFKDSINQVTEALDAKKAIYDEFAGSSDNSQDKIDEAKVQLKELQEKYTNTVTSIQDLQENMIVIQLYIRRKQCLKSELKLKKKEYDRFTTKLLRKWLMTVLLKVERLKPAYEEAVTAESSAKKNMTLLPDSLKKQKAYDDATDEA
ncbi:MAG: hypothetical protein ACLRMX_10220 [Lachnospira eligens]